MAGDSVFLNTEEIEADVTLASEYLTDHESIFSDTEHQDLESKINSIITNIGIVKNDIHAWGTADKIGHDIEDAFSDIVNHISPDNNPFAFLKDFTNTDAVDMMMDNGIGGAFVPDLAVNTENVIDNETLTAGVSRDGSLLENGYGLSIDGFTNNGEANGNVIGGESYGVSYDVGSSSFVAKIGDEGDADSSTYDTTIYTKGNEYRGETFTYKVGVDQDSLIQGDLNITHKFELVPPPDDAPEGWSREKMLSVTVTMTNSGSSAIENLKYRRLVDFDNGYSLVDDDSDFTVTSFTGISNGDATLEALGALSWESISNPSSDPTINYDSGAGDYDGDDFVALMQFKLDTLAAGETKEFSFFYAGDESESGLSYTIDEAVTDARYVSSTSSTEDPYHHTFALGTGSLIDSFSEAEVEGKEADHFNILTDSLSLMIRDLAKIDYVARTVADEVSSGGRIEGPEGIVIDGGGDLILADTTHGALLRIKKDDTDTFPTGYSDDVVVIYDGSFIRRPTDVAIDVSNGDLIVTDWDRDAVIRIPLNASGVSSSGRYYITDYDISDEWIGSPMGVEIDSNGDIIVAENYNQAILRIDPANGDTEAIATYSSPDWLPDGPTDLAIDSKGYLIVTDWSSSAVYRVDPVTGETEVIADYGTTGGLIYYPTGIAIDSNGLLVVSDEYKDTVIKIDPVTGDTRVIATKTGNKIDDPYGLAVDSDGSIFVANKGADSFVDDSWITKGSVVKLEETTSTNYLLAFAQKIRGDMVTHDDEHTGDAADQVAHDDFITAVDKVIDDIGTNISDPNTVDKMDIFKDLRDARDSLMVHADMKEPVQHASIAHILLDSKRLADDAIRLNLASIDAEMNQAKAFLDTHINDFGDTTVHRDIRSQMASIITNINTVKGNIYDTAASAISSGIKEAFCDVIDHMVHSDAGHGHEGRHEENPFVFCHHDEG
jgi:sugar lactone lactonase YvrE